MQRARAAQVGLLMRSYRESFSPIGGRRGLTQEAVLERMGSVDSDYAERYSHATVSRWESGGTRPTLQRRSSRSWRRSVSQDGPSICKRSVSMRCPHFIHSILTTRMFTTNAQTDLSKTHIRNRAEKMTDEPIRPSEDPLLVFISSRQDEELSLARGLAIEEVESYPGMKAWAFEDAPASSEQARDRYITNAGKADLVIWLIGSTTTTPIVEEVSACMRAQGKLLAFKLPAPERDDETESLIKRVSDYATWKPVENVEDLPAHIKSALTDEMLRRYRDPAPINHDLFLKQKHRESIADTKRLWTTLGVPEDIADELADDHSVGHKLTLPTTGMLTVNAQQGSGKTLAAQRLYQLALVNRLQDHSQPLPVFLNARNISGDLKDQIEGYTREQGSIYTQRVLVVIDGLDETGRHKANQLLNQAQSYTDANQNVAAVVMTRPLPGLKSAEDPFVLPECNEEEFLFIASKIAGRKVNRVEIPFREYQSRLHCSLRWLART